MDKRIPIIRIRTRQAEGLSGKPIVFTNDAWDRTSRFPAGHSVRSLGEMDTLLTGYDVQCRPCPEAVLDSCLTRGTSSRSRNIRQTRGGRKSGLQRFAGSWHRFSWLPSYRRCPSLRSPSERELRSRRAHCGCHHFVKPNTPLDEEAAARGTTVYFVDKRIDMLLMFLGTGLCSLKLYIERTHSQ